MYNTDRKHQYDHVGWAYQPGRRHHERGKSTTLTNVRTLIVKALLVYIAFQSLTRIYHYTTHDSCPPYKQHVNANTPIVTILNGSLTGTFNPYYATEHFLGIPYAQPPIGKLRFNRPQPLQQSWQGVRNATEYAKPCYQRSAGYDHSQSEDCLALNVIRPASTTEYQNLPVAVWIHGGGYVTGSTRDKPYNLSYIVHNSVQMGKPIIAISIAYRLSGFGFLDSSLIRKQGVTNLGIRDQRFALEWIRENIAAFGGGPSKVTIWGESAGAGSVGVHLIAYDGRDDGLFRGAIGESGGPLRLGPPGDTREQRQGVFDYAVQKLGCDGYDDDDESASVLDCLRDADVDELHEVLRGFQYWPYEDGDLIRGSQHEQLLKGRFVRVPYLMGTNTDEGVMFAKRGINSDEQFEAMLNETGAGYEAVKNIQLVYPDIPALGIPEGLTGPLNEDLGFQYKRLAAFWGDWWMTAPRRLAMQQWAAHDTPAWSYRFNTIVNPWGPEHGVGHFDEVAFVFNNIDDEGYPDNPFFGRPQTYKDLSQLMCRMWISFVHDGDPNGHLMDDVPYWPGYDNGLGGYGQNFVFTAGSVGVENDVYRGVAMAYLNSLWKDEFNR